MQTVCEEAGWDCRTAAGGEEGCALFQREWPDVVVLDVMMPKVDGFEVCRRIREVDENVPVLFLSARDGIIDKRIGFSFGGEEYLDGAISIAVYVRKIREKIEENPAKPAYLKTVWGVGYSFEA